MSERWAERAFAELLLIPLRSGLTRPKASRGAGIRMVNMGELFSFPRMADPPMERVPVSKREMRECLLTPGDLLFARRSLVLAGAGKCAVVTSLSEPTTYEGSLIRARLDPAKAEPLFYYYFFSSGCGRARMATIIEQVAAAGIRGSDLSRLRVPCPPLCEQRSIARALGSLDDKIDLNRRMNETLEAIAQAIFKSWFVDFDPVRAKAEGRPPAGMDAGTAALFPDSFSGSVFGEMPRAWRVARVDDLGRVVTGGTPSTADSRNFGGPIPFIRIPDMDGQVFVVRTARTLSERGRLSQQSRELPPLAVCVSCIATPGLVSLTAETSHTNQQINSVICREGVSPYYSFLALRHIAEDVATLGSGGTATLNLSKSGFSSMQVLLPHPPVMKAFHDLVEPLFARILLNSRQSLTLAALRDTLLPKLMSGEARVRNAETSTEGLT